MMIPVMQTKFGKEMGNCLQACVASVLEIGIDDVPDFNESDKKWFEALYTWCSSRRVGLLFMDATTASTSLLTGVNPIMIYKVVGSDEEHAVVGGLSLIKGEKWEWLSYVAHDPNPMIHKRGELTGVLVLIR